MAEKHQRRRQGWLKLGKIWTDNVILGTQTSKFSKSASMLIVLMIIQSRAPFLLLKSCVVVVLLGITLRPNSFL